MMQQATAPQPFTIVMAEDDPDDQFLVREAFDDVCLKNPLEFVNDGVELIDYLRREGAYASRKGSPLPGLILLDLNMPRMDGREALKIIKSDASLCRIPVVVMTTSKAEEDIAKSYNLGANSYIVKPGLLKNLMDVARSVSEYWTQIVTVPSGSEGEDG
jgi:CheY-like chemotaxis protein